MKSIKHLMSLDLRSMAFVRVVLGVLAFFDIYRRIPEIDAFFSDAGILPRSVLIEELELTYKMSLLNLNGSYSFALILALVGMLAAVFYALGWRTRLANFITWIVIISFQVRFPEASTTGGDILLRVFLFWSFFLPMNAYYSVDRVMTETKHEGKEYFSIFSSAWIIQIMLLYIMTFFYKWAPVYTKDFNAVYFILNLDFMTTDFGKWLSHYPTVMKFLSIASYGLEGIGPLLLFIPYRRDLFRGAAVLSFWLFHLGIGATLHLGNFVPICLIIWAGLIPTAWWNFHAELVKSTAESVKILYYDVENAFSRKLCLLIKEFLFLSNLKLIPANVDPAANALMKEKDTLVVENAGSLCTGFKAFESALRTSDFILVRMLGRIPFSKLDAPDESFGAQLFELKEKGEVTLTSAAKDASDIPDTTQYSWRKAVERIETIFDHIGVSNVRYKITYLEKIFGYFIVSLVVLWNIEGYYMPKSWKIGAPFDQIMFTFQLDQGWAMFAPHPQRSDGWWVMEGKLKNGGSWDALNDREVTFDTPEDWHGSYSTDNWRKLMDNIQAERDELHLQWLGRYLCRKWNNAHFDGEELQTFNLYFMQEFTNHPDDPPAKINKLRLWQHSCY